MTKRIFLICLLLSSLWSSAAAQRPFDVGDGCFRLNGRPIIMIQVENEYGSYDYDAPISEWGQPTPKY